MQLTQNQISGTSPLLSDNIWWLYQPSTKQIIAAYEDVHRCQLREVTLPKCVEIWGWNPLGCDNLSIDVIEKDNYRLGKQVVVNNISYTLPVVSGKYLKWLHNRKTICKEMSNMAQIGGHPNIIELLEVLELIQDSKATLFLVLEYINGGELFDRIKLSNVGTSDLFARQYFTQLLSGINYCHQRGVVHRDLKPENLLLSDTTENASLKIADFGMSAVIFAAEAVEYDRRIMTGPSLSSPSGYSSSSSLSPPSEPEENIFCFSPYSKSAHSQSLNSLIPTRRLKSIVGSPHYIAPEIINSDQAGYDGSKVDMWSAGVILYALLIGKHPFGSDLSSCPHFQRYKRWSLENSSAIESGKDVSVPSWFFPSWITPLASSLIISLLQCDPSKRPTAVEALLHPWCLGGSSASTLREFAVDDIKNDRLGKIDHGSALIHDDDENVIVVCEEVGSMSFSKPSVIPLSPIRTQYLTDPSPVRSTSKLSPTNSIRQKKTPLTVSTTNMTSSNNNDSSDDNDSEFMNRINKQRLQNEITTTTMIKDNKPDKK